MSGHHVNQLVDDGHRHHHAPTEMAVGVLTGDVTIESVSESLQASGVEADRLYFMHGPEAIDLVNDARGFFARLFSQDAEKPLAALAAGATLIGVTGVSSDEIDEMRHKIIAAGAINRAYLGKWTNE